MNKTKSLDQAVEIVKEYANSTKEGRQPEVLLESVYKKLKELGEDALK
jgi:hypothetical protein